MKKLISFIVLLTSLLFMSLQVASANDSDPVSMLQSLADQMIANLKTNKATLKTNPTLVYSLARKIVVPHADLGEMSKRVLPPQIWNSATASQRSQFENEFTTLLVRTYASALSDYTDQTVKFYPVRGGVGGKNTVRVDSQIIRSDGAPINVNYRLIRQGSVWKLYDMTVEGVSLIESFRSQFSDKVAQGSDMAGLIQYISDHNAKNGG
jgi:phospholipid transport system substrate-binding protein